MSYSKYIKKNGFDISISSYLKKAVDNNQISYKTETSKTGVRLDHYAYKQYNDSSAWWVIAAASGIGWWLQMPEGIELKIPTSLDQIDELKEKIKAL